MKQKNKNKGITLIALVITIIILLILAGVAIGQLTGNGLFDKAKLAKEKYESYQNQENDTLMLYENIIEDLDANEKIFAEDVSFTPEDSNWNVKNVKEALDYLIKRKYYKIINE